MAKNVNGQSLLPEDLVIEILACMAVKPLVRFRCVSKPWNSLIRSRMFINIHLHKNQQTNNNDHLDHLLLLKHLQEEETLFSFYDVDSPPLLELRVSSLGADERTRLLGPCNGLVLLVHENYAYILNPALREHKLLPPCPFSDPVGYCGHAFYEYYSSTWGFGSALCTSDVNVVQLQCTMTYLNNGNRVISTKAHVYCSNTNSWRKINDICTVAIPSGSYDWSGVFLNGTCHWHAFCLSHESYSYAILTFDLSTEIFKQLEYPERFWGLRIGVYSPTKLNECLAAILRCQIDIMYVYEVWVMREYGVMESWTKQCVIEPHIYLRPLSFWKNDEWLLAESQDGQLISCSLRDYEIKRFQIHGVSLLAVIYKESLISLN